MKDINVKVPVLDQTVELVKDFIQKIINPPLEEVGGLLADQIKFWRFKNQIEIVLKADAYMKEKNIKTKKISLKVLAPLLEDCSLEEDETLQQKWVALLVNSVKEGSGIDNSLYSYILSQLSPRDAKVLETINYTGLQVSKNEDSAIWINEKKYLTVTEIKKKDPEASISIDNLIRLRLLKELGPSNLDPMVMITDLGMRFAMHCSML